MAKRQKPVIEIILEVINDVSKISINATAGVDGFYCELFYPLNEKVSDVSRVFANDTQEYDYNPVYDKKGQYIVLGVFGDKFRSSDASFDQYGTDNAYVLTHKDEKLPVNTRIIVYRGKEFHIFKVQEHFVYPSVKGQIYFKNMLVPWN